MVTHGKREQDMTAWLNTVKILKCKRCERKCRGAYIRHVSRVTPVKPAYIQAVKTFIEQTRQMMNRHPSSDQC